MREDKVYKAKLDENYEKRDRYLAEQISGSDEKNAPGEESTKDIDVGMQDDQAEGGNVASSSKDHQHIAIPVPPDTLDMEATSTASDMDADIAVDSDIPLATEDVVKPVDKKNRISAVTEKGGSRYDVCEAFSPPRMCIVAEKNNLRAGWSLDISTRDKVTDRNWDLSKKTDQDKFFKLRKRDRPKVLGVSAPCTVFSTLQNLRKGGIPTAELEKGRELVRVSMTACKKQYYDDLYFFHEHPLRATSWKEPCVR